MKGDFCDLRKASLAIFCFFSTAVLSYSAPNQPSNPFLRKLAEKRKQLGNSAMKCSFDSTKISIDLALQTVSGKLSCDDGSTADISISGSDAIRLRLANIYFSNLASINEIQGTFSGLHMDTILLEGLHATNDKYVVVTYAGLNLPSLSLGLGPTSLEVKISKTYEASTTTAVSLRHLKEGRVKVVRGAPQLVDAVGQEIEVFGIWTLSRKIQVTQTVGSGKGTQIAKKLVPIGASDVTSAKRWKALKNLGPGEYVLSVDYLLSNFLSREFNYSFVVPSNSP